MRTRTRTCTPRCPVHMNSNGSMMDPSTCGAKGASCLQPSRTTMQDPCRQVSITAFDSSSQPYSVDGGILKPLGRAVPCRSQLKLHAQSTSTPYEERQPLLRIRSNVTPYMYAQFRGVVIRPATPSTGNPIPSPLHFEVRPCKSELGVSKVQVRLEYTHGHH